MNLTAKLKNNEALNLSRYLRKNWAGIPEYFSTDPAYLKIETGVI